ncbi:MAG: hypothetical protein JJE22_16150 [Bacteroidia bacterium]|nr:hypothetical protein [Bacteroidia bacterium]
MKKIILSLVLFFTVGTVLGQSFMHGAGLTIFAGSAKGSDVTVGEGFTYYPRFNILETEKLSLSAGIPLTAGISISTSYYYSSGSGYYDDGSIGFIVNVPFIISLNMGRGSTKDNTDKFGYFVGAGFGYHHGDFLVDDYNGYVTSKSTNAYGPAANAGFRIGVGRKHRNIEVRFSYMKGITEDKPNVFGVGALFNF